MDEKDRFLGCLLGLATGDAVGTALEFQPPGSFTPISDMVGGGPFDLAPGEWTDDTSMALCLAMSLVESGRFDAADQMSRYCRWVEEGYLSSNGRCFDIGGTVSAALRRFQETGDPLAGATDHRTAGNGCIVRLAPVPMFCYPDEALADKYAAESSRTTHGAAVCGQVAGAYYGASGIPEHWLERLAMRQEITDLAHRLFARGPGALGEHLPMRNQRRVALPTSWEANPFCPQDARLAFQKSYSAAEFAVIARGNIPESMDDRWFACMQERVLFIYRSWSGICLYRVTFEEEGCYVVKEAVANPNPAEHGTSDAEFDADVLNYLIDRWLGKWPSIPTRSQK